MKYVCPICGYVYDDSAGPAWNELPDDWKCPLCGAAKADFRPESAEGPRPVTPAPAVQKEMRSLSAAELSAVCSSLAKGCEKQYRQDQADAFRRIAQWLKERSGEAPDPSFSKILEKVEEDLSVNYPAARAASAGAGDGKEELKEGTGVYVCTVCGFVYVGDSLPDVCPVCKVPNSKFEKIGG